MQCNIRGDMEDLVMSIARSFGRSLMVEIGNKDMANVVRLNRSEKDNSVCHTHDFCDANMVMNEVMEKHYLFLFHESGAGEEVDKVRDTIIDFVWETAWEVAKNNDFFMENMD